MAQYLSPYSPLQPGTGDGLFVGILRLEVVGSCFSHSKVRLFFLREEADWNKPLTVLLSQAFCQWLVFQGLSHQMEQR